MDALLTFQTQVSAPGPANSALCCDRSDPLHQLLFFATAKFSVMQVALRHPTQCWSGASDEELSPFDRSFSDPPFLHSEGGVTNQFAKCRSNLALSSLTIEATFRVDHLTHPL